MNDADAASELCVQGSTDATAGKATQDLNPGDVHQLPPPPEDVTSRQPDDVTIVQNPILFLDALYTKHRDIELRAHLDLRGLQTRTDVRDQRYMIEDDAFAWRVRVRHIISCCCWHAHPCTNLCFDALPCCVIKGTG